MWWPILNSRMHVTRLMMLIIAAVVLVIAAHQAAVVAQAVASMIATEFVNKLT